MPGLKRRGRIFILFAAVALARTDAFASSQSRQPDRPCVLRSGREATLRPRDEAAQRPDFVAFRRQLQEAAVARNGSVVLGVVHPSARVGFDGSGGPEAFRQQHMENPEENFWDEFNRILGWGGSFDQNQTFSAPYVFSIWPQDLDSFECLAVVGTGVRLRERPTLQAQVLAVLTHTIVQVTDEEPSDAAQGWQRVRTGSGRVGYVARRYLRSPVDHRAIFEFRDGRWWLMAYIAGD